MTPLRPALRRAVALIVLRNRRVRFIGATMRFRLTPVRIRKCFVGFWALAALGISVRPALSQSRQTLLGSVSLELSAFAESSGYFLYEYRIANPEASRAGVAVVSLDVSAPRGTGRIRLPDTGIVDRGSGENADHVPMGFIVPKDWRAMLAYHAQLMWYAEQAGEVVNDTWSPANGDSVAPGATKGGFAIRSSYLPGIRRFYAEPTLQSCCARPIPGDPEGAHASQSAFLVRGITVGPVVNPRDLTLNTMMRDTQTACSSLDWIRDATVCSRIRSALQRVLSAQEQGGTASVRDALRELLGELDNEHGAGKPVNENAYWLLRINGQYLLEHSQE